MCGVCVCVGMCMVWCMCIVYVCGVVSNPLVCVCVFCVCRGKAIIEPWPLTNNHSPRPTASFSFGLCCTAKRKAGKTWGHSSRE